MPINTYGGQFQGLSGTATQNAISQACSGAPKAHLEVQEQSAEIGEKIIIRLGDLKAVRGLPPLEENDKQYICTVLIFSGEKIQDVMKLKNRRSEISKCSVMEGGIVMPETLSQQTIVARIPKNATPGTQASLYMAVITEGRKQEDEKTYVTYNLMGFSQTPSISLLKKLKTELSVQMLAVEKENSGIEPGSLTYSVEVCDASAGPAAPENIELEIMEECQKLATPS